MNSVYRPLLLARRFWQCSSREEKAARTVWVGFSFACGIILFLSLLSGML